MKLLDKSYTIAQKLPKRITFFEKIYVYKKELLKDMFIKAVHVDNLGSDHHLRQAIVVISICRSYLGFDLVPNCNSKTFYI